jgi:toxin HigB-1
LALANVQMNSGREPHEIVLIHPVNDQRPLICRTLSVLNAHTRACYCLTIVTFYSSIVIVGFKSEETKLIFEGFTSCDYPPNIQRIALRKLLLLDAATSVMDLRVPPGNRLEKLVGDRKGQYSIRINNQWRICFVWTDENNADQVEIVDYH